MIDLAYKKNLIAALEKPNVEASFLLGAAIRAMHRSDDKRERATAMAVDAFLAEWFATGLPMAEKAAKEVVARPRPQ